MYINYAFFVFYSILVLQVYGQVNTRDIPKSPQFSQQLTKVSQFTRDVKMILTNPHTRPAQNPDIPISPVLENSQIDNNSNKETSGSNILGSSLIAGRPNQRPSSGGNKDIPISPSQISASGKNPSSGNTGTNSNLPISPILHGPSLNSNLNQNGNQNQNIPFLNNKPASNPTASDVLYPIIVPGRNGRQNTQVITSEFCTREFDPVCGSVESINKKITFGNKCSLEFEQIRTPGLIFLKKGAC